MSDAEDRYAFRAGGRDAFHRRYSAGKHVAQGRYPAAIAAGSSAKNTRRFA